MSTSKERYNAIISNIDHSSFDSVNGAFEKLLDFLENEDDCDQEVFEQAMGKANELKNEAKSLLSKEKEDILRMARENGIDPKELGLNEYSSDDDDYDDDDDDNSNSDPSPPRKVKEKNITSNKSKNESKSDEEGCCLLI